MFSAVAAVSMMAAERRGALAALQIGHNSQPMKPVSPRQGAAWPVGRASTLPKAHDGCRSAIDRGWKAPLSGKSRLNEHLGLTIVLVEQHVDFARRAADRFIVLNLGSAALEESIGALTDEVVHRHLTG